MDVSIVIPSWNVRDLLRKNLQSVFRHTSNLRVEVCVVDNGSADGSAEMVRKEFSRVKLIANPENRGFAKAVNQGIKATSGEYVLIYNDDAEFADDHLKDLLSYLKIHPEVGVAGCHLINVDGSTQASVRRDPTFFDQAFILLKLRNFFPQLFSRYECAGFDYAKEQAVVQLMGAFLLIPRHVLDEVGIFDEGFFAWFEEVDLQRRIREAGYKLVYLPQMTVRHVKGASFGKISPMKLQLIWQKSLRHYFWKHGQYLTWFFLLPFQLIGLLLASLVQLVGRAHLKSLSKERYGQT